MAVDKASRVNAIPEVHFTEQKHSMMLRQRFKRQMVREEINKQAQEASEYFQHRQEEVVNTGEHRSLANKFLNQLGESSGSLIEESTIEGAILYEDPDFIENYCARYVSGSELDTLEDLLGLEDKKNKLYDLLSKCEDGQELDILDGYSKAFNKGEIYLLIIAVLDRLRRERLKENFKSRLIGVLEQFQKQESGYLFTFFKAVKDEKIQNSGAVNKAAKLVETAEGNQNLEGVRQVVSLVEKDFNNNYSQLVSLYMKVCAQQLQAVSLTNKENQNQLLNLLRTEKYLITAQTLYARMHEIRDFLAIHEVIMTNNDSQAILQLLNLFESTFVTELSLNNLFNGWQLKNISVTARCTIVNYLLTTVALLPVSLFSNSMMDKAKFGDALRKILQFYTSYEDKALEQNSLGLSFLRNIPQKIKYT
jgi:hypothetical protein